MASKTTGLPALALLAALGGCSGGESLRSTLDDRGTTWVSATSIVTLARPVPRFSAAARDYLYVAPLEVNRMGALRHYLWVGLGTTVDRAWQAAAPATAATLVVKLDGVPVVLPLGAWDVRFTPEPYSTPAPVYQVLRAAVSQDQLARLADARSIEVQVIADDGTAARYELWHGAWSDLRAFIARVAPQTLGAAATP